MVIIAAVDRSDVAADVLEEALTLADKFDDSTHVVHVMKRSEVIKAEENINEDDPVSIDELRESAADVPANLIDNYHTSLEATPVGLIGDPATEITEYAIEHDARYIVVSPQRKSQTGKILFGSVAQAIILNAPCPVVSLLNNWSH